MFRINYIKNHEREGVLVNFGESLEYKNYYTIITGENGCGKSSLLSKAVNTYIFDSTEKSSECLTAGFSEQTPSRVIAICNARYNKFASMRTYIQQSNLSYPNFYIQNEQNLEVSRSLQSVMQSVVREIIDTDRVRGLGEQRSLNEVEGVKTAFNMVGIQPVIAMKIELNLSYINAIRRIYQAEERGETLSNLSYESYNKDFMTWRKKAGVHDSLVKDLFEMYIELRKKPNALGVIDIRLDYLSLNIKSNSIPQHLVIAALAVGFIIPTRLQVQRNNSLKWVSINSLSSGQQAMMMNAVVISVFAKQNALICIDEPENSLHPEWQLNYMSFINYLCPEDIGCHFLVATHSPQIISGIKSDNGCVVSLIRNNERLFDYLELENDGSENKSSVSRVQEIHSIASFLRQSADRQLVNVFRSPGFGNESIIHRLMLILTKQAKKFELNTEDEGFIHEIARFIDNGKIDEYDPATVIFKQIIAFKKQEASNDKKFS